MIKEDRKRIMFFAEHAGFRTPPGRLACAKEMAESELAGLALDLECIWEHEQEDWIDFVGDCEPTKTWLRRFEQGTHEVFYAYVENHNGDHLAGLGGIVLERGETNYKRVVQAELFAEAIDSLKGIGVTGSPE